MPAPSVILDPHWRGMAELFSAADLTRLHDTCDVVWGRDAPIPADVLADALPQAKVLIAAEPVVTRDTLDAAPHLRMVIEVSGAFPDSIDYVACAARGVEVLSCAPGFRQAVAEMGLAMALTGGRGLIAEHERFRKGAEHWLEDHAETDFTLYGADIGFVGFGQIAQEMTRLLTPFAPVIRAYDPWLPDDVAAEHGVTLTSLQTVMSRSRCVFVTAIPTAENLHLLDAAALAQMPRHALFVLLSRAHLVDFDALRDAVMRGHIRAAIDVFPTEPVPADDPIRTAPGAILSPHRAAAVKDGRQLIGRMIVDDISAFVSGSPDRRLAVADPERIAVLAGATDAAQVAAMSKSRQPG